MKLVTIILLLTSICFAKERRDKAGGLVTHYAVFRRGYMGTGLADDGIAIVARDAVIGNTRVIKLGTGKGGGVMTA